MVIKNNVHSSNKVFKQLEVNIDTVFYRFNERKWYEEDEETGKKVHIGWIYDEIWYEKDNYIEELSKENELLSQALIDISTEVAKENIKNEAAIVELANLLGGMM